MHDRCFYQSPESHRWPVVEDRRDYSTGNPDQRYMYVTSAWFVALAGGQPGWFPGVGERRTAEEGWWFCLGLGEHEHTFRIVLDVDLSREEETACIARGRWPLLRVPLGVLMIGSGVWEKTATLEVVGGEEVITVPYGGEAYVVVVMPPGNYEVEILEYLDYLDVFDYTGPSLLFHLTRTEAEPKCPAVLSLRPSKSLPTAVEALAKRFLIAPLPEKDVRGRNIKRSAVSMDDLDAWYPGARDRSGDWTRLRLPPLDRCCVDGVMKTRKHGKRWEDETPGDRELPVLHVRTSDS